MKWTKGIFIAKIVSKNIRSARWVWTPHGGFMIAMSTFESRLRARPSIRCSRIVHNDDPSTSSTFVLKVSTVTESHSTMVTCSAPRKAAPIPRTPLPAPKSRICFPSNPSPSPILVNHAAARFPSVGYCSSSTK